MGSHIKLSVQTDFDERLFDLAAAQLHDELQGPTLFDLTQPNQRPLFVSTLLHGNETTGWDAARAILQERRSDSLLLFIGNVRAAADGLRSTPHGVDFNRIWASPSLEKTPFAEETIAYVKEKNPWFALDIHNNSGPNPPYSLLTRLTHDTLGAAAAFSDKAIYCRQPPGVITRRTTEFCPSIAIEVGVPHAAESEARAIRFTKALLDSGSVPELGKSQPRLFANPHRVLVESPCPDDLNGFPILNSQLDAMNFRRVKKGSVLATLVSADWRIRVQHEAGVDTSDEYIARQGDDIVLKKDAIISMYTRNPQIAVEDCVCYLLVEIPPFNG